MPKPSHLVLFDASMVGGCGGREEIAQLAGVRVNPKSGQAEEAAAEAENRRTRDLEVAHAGATVPAHDVVSSAGLGKTVGAENTIGQASSKTEILILDPIEVALMFTVYHPKMGTEPIPPPPEAEPVRVQLSSLSVDRYTSHVIFPMHIARV